MAILSAREIEAFERDGFIMLENALEPDVLKTLRREFHAWVEESRTYAENYGETIDKRPRFSVQPGHCAEAPGLRRISSPNEISDSYLNAMRTSIAVDAVCELFGPNLRFNNAKVNSKLPGAGTEVKFHQDFPFELHSNDNLMSVLYFLDEVTLENGPLEVVAGSHKGPLYDLRQDGVFTGAVDPSIAEWAQANSQPCIGPAGSACLMHTRLLHGSAPNRSDQPRTLFICAYNAEDAVPIQQNHIPSIHQGELIRGVETGRVRCSDFDSAFAEMPKGASFFEQQSKAAN